MAYSFQEYPADGVTASFTVPFPYFDQSEVRVFVDGVEDTAFQFSSANLIILDNTPTAGQLVRVARESNLETRAVDFVAGAVLSEEDLDTAISQVFYGTQEAVDTSKSALRADLDGLADMQGRQVKNMADPSAPDHGVNLNFIQTEYPNVTAVKNNEADITNCATNMADINDLSTNMADINLNATNMPDINTVAGAMPFLNTNAVPINTVATNINDVTDLAAAIDDINTVAASFITSETEPATANTGDRWFQPSTNTLFLYGNDAVWYEAAVYEVVRSFEFNAQTQGQTTFTGTDFFGNTLFIPVGAHVDVWANGQILSKNNYGINGTGVVELYNGRNTGDRIHIRAYAPMRSDDFTWFEQTKNDAETAATNANNYMGAALLYKDSAFLAKDTAYQHMVDAQAHRDNALAYRDDANTYKLQAQTYASNASTSASDAATTAATVNQIIADFEATLAPDTIDWTNILNKPTQFPNGFQTTAAEGHIAYNSTTGVVSMYAGGVWRQIFPAVYS